MNRHVVSDSPDICLLLDQLARPQAFPYTLSAQEVIVKVQTPVSAVLLVRERSYKLRKASGSEEYATPEQRLAFCEQEVLHGTSQAPQAYLGIAPVLALAGGSFGFGPIFAPGEVPLPGTLLPPGWVIDYAVVMQRPPEETTLAALVAAGSATPELLATVARSVAAWHHRSLALAAGPLRSLRGTWEELTAQIAPCIGLTLDQTTFDRLSAYMDTFLDGYAPLLRSRVREQRICTSPLDLRLPHVSLSSQTPDAIQHITFADYQGFAPQVYPADVAADVAVLTMELEAAGRFDLSKAFVDAYIAQTNDAALSDLLPFYACYAACVRGGWLSLKLKQPGITFAQYASARQEAAALFTLALRYASGPTRPTLLLVGGLMGSGKDMLSDLLHMALRWDLISADDVLGKVEIAPSRARHTGKGLHVTVDSVYMYQAMLKQATALLARGHSVILTAPFARKAHRHAVSREAAFYGANLIFVECQCPRELALQRLLQREAVSGVAAGLDLYDAQAASWQTFHREDEPSLEYLPISTASLLPPALLRILGALSIPQPFLPV